MSWLARRGDEAMHCSTNEPCVLRFVVGSTSGAERFRLRRLVSFLAAALFALLGLASSVGAIPSDYDGVLFIHDEAVNVASGSTIETPVLLAPVVSAQGAAAHASGAVECPYDSATSFVAPGSVPEIKPGDVTGPTSEKPFGQPVKDAVVAENLATTGGEVPVCVWCHMETPSPHIDHAVPKSHGGNATITNGQVSCPHCNMSRGNGPHPVTPPVGYEGPWPPPHWPS